MKVYIFVTHGMSGIGGGQRYVLSKARWLVNQGWDVCICHVKNGDILLDLSGLRVIDIPELRAHPKMLGQSKVESIIRDILAPYAGAESVYVESSAPYLGLWGELIAQDAHGRHLCFAIEEEPSPEDNNFLQYKKKRHEIGFIKNSIAARAFGNPLANAASFDDCVLIAYNPSPIEEVPFSGKIVHGDYTIGCISRLDKPAVALMMKGIAEFCDLHPTVHISLALIGDTPYEDVRAQIQSFGENRDNLIVQILGYMSPIPWELVSQFDLCIGKAGAAMITSELGIPTIRYTLDSDELAGFDRLERSNGKTRYIPSAQPIESTLSQLLEYAFLQGGLEKFTGGVDRPSDKLIDYSDHLAFIPEDNTYQYYDVWHGSVGWRRKIVSIWIRLFRNTRYEVPLMALRECFGKKS